MLTTGFTVLYARPFGHNRGVGRLPEEFRKFRDPRLQNTHVAVLEARDKFFAHTDADCTYCDKHQNEKQLLELEVVVGPAGADGKSEIGTRISTPDGWFQRLDLPPHLVVLYDSEDTGRIQEALDQKVPFNWGSGDCYLFGKQFWTATKRDKLADPEELRLLFLEAVDKERARLERLRRKFSGQAGAIRESKRDTIPESVRIFVWRRDEGRCVKCGSQERLEFDHIIPVCKGGSSTERNVQLLCEPCNRKKSADI